MAKWKIYLKWGRDEGFFPNQRIFNSKKSAQNYFDNSSLKQYNDDGWIAEYKIQKVGE